MRLPALMHSLLASHAAVAVALSPSPGLAHRPDVKFETSVTRWFDTEGSLLEEDFREAVLERVRQFERVDKKTS